MEVEGIMDGGQEGWQRKSLACSKPLCESLVKVLGLEVTVWILISLCLRCDCF